MKRLDVWDYMILTLVVLILISMISGCTFIYDSRNQNAASVGEGNYGPAKAKDFKFKTGRFACVSTYKKECKQYLKGETNE